MTEGIKNMINQKKKKIRKYLQNNYPSLIVNAVVNIVIVIMSVFIGAYLALQNTIEHFYA